MHLAPSEKEENGGAVNAGAKMYIDFAGSKLQVTEYDGTVRDVEVFVAILCCSQLTYVEAVESQRKEDLIKATENTLHYFGGVPQAIVPDNLKSAVTKGSKYEAVLNEELPSVSSCLRGIVRQRPLLPLHSSVRFFCRALRRYRDPGPGVQAP